MFFGDGKSRVEALRQFELIRAYSKGNARGGLIYTKALREKDEIKLSKELLERLDAFTNNKDMYIEQIIRQSLSQ